MAGASPLPPAVDRLDPEGDERIDLFLQIGASYFLQAPGRHRLDRPVSLHCAAMVLFACPPCDTSY
jgi:hypothetical protein